MLMFMKITLLIYVATKNRWRTNKEKKNYNLKNINMGENAMVDFHLCALPATIGKHQQKIYVLFGERNEPSSFPIDNIALSLI